MRFSTASQWITWMSSLHPNTIELGLERIKMVAGRLSILEPSCPVITVGGTNGKGSTVAALESIYRQAGYKVGAFTSPMLFTPNEQIRIDGQHVSDTALCAAFERVADALQEITLTQFEFFTLAAFVIFKQCDLDVWILEVGLGGRLDAVNIIDADAAVVTTIALDHMDWLGDTREKIGYEKAGILRAGKPAVCGDSNPPQTLVDYAREIGALWFCQGVEFGYREDKRSWSWYCAGVQSVIGADEANHNTQTIRFHHLPITKLAIQNMSTALMTLTSLQSKLPVTEQSIKTGLEKVNLSGRIEIIPGAVTTIFDVSHNPASVALLAKKLTQLPINGKVVGVFSMLGDKDIVASINAIKHKIDEWYIAPLAINRGASVEKLVEAFEKAHVTTMTMYTDIIQAYQHAIVNTKPGDCIVIFGSFHTIEIIKK